MLIKKVTKEELIAMFNTPSYTMQDIQESRHPYMICTLPGFDYDSITEYYINGTIIERKGSPTLFRPLTPIWHWSLY